MSDRDKIAEIIREARINASPLSQLGYPEADALIERGAILPPCKVGDTIYRVGDPIKKAYEWDIERIEIYADEIVYIDDSDNEFTNEDIGKTVFLTREEAEKKLEEMRGNVAKG